MTLAKGHKDLEAKGQLYHVGASFEAFCEGVLKAASDFSCKFFVSGLEQCGRNMSKRSKKSKEGLHHVT